MSGILSQLGIAEETQSTPVITTIVPSAGPPNIFTATTGTPHGLLPQDTVTISGATPATYNGTWTIYQVPTASTFTVVTTTLLAACTLVGTYLAGIYGRGPTVNRFYDLVSEGLKLTSPRIESAGLRAGNRVERADKWAINRTGAAGPLVLEVQSKGFALLCKHLMGALASAGPTDGAYTYTATIAAMLGKSLIAQVGKPMTQSQIVSPFTYPGVKIIDWTLSCAVDGILMLALTLDAMDEQTTVVLAAASYPSGSELLTYAGGSVTVGGVAVDVNSFDVKCVMGYAADRRFIRANTLQREPAEATYRAFTFDLVAEFTDLQQYNRFASTTRAGALATLSATYTAPSLIGATTYPSLTIASGVNCARFDSDSPVVAGPGLLPLPLSGTILNSAAVANDALSLTYVTADILP